MRKGLKMESHDLSLKREGMAQGRVDGNGHVLTAHEGRRIREPRRSALQGSFLIFNMGT